MIEETLPSSVENISYEKVLLQTSGKSKNEKGEDGIVFDDFICADHTKTIEGDKTFSFIPSIIIKRDLHL